MKHYLVHIMNLNDDPRALQRAQNAEAQRMRRANRGSLDEEYNHRRARRVIPGVREHESAQRAVTRDEPGVQERSGGPRSLQSCRKGHRARIEGRERDVDFNSGH